MLGASLSEVWGEDFKIKKKKKKKNITPPMSPDEMDSELLINPSEKTKMALPPEQIEQITKIQFPTTRM